MTDFTNSYAARKIPASVVVAIAAAGDDLAEIAIMALSYARDDSDIFIAVGLISKIVSRAVWLKRPAPETMRSAT